MTETTPRRPFYRVRGTTDTETTCGVCGREELKGTVVLSVLDVDGNDAGEIYAGTGCAATLTGQTTRAVRADVKTADRERYAQLDRLHREHHNAQRSASDQWLTARGLVRTFTTFKAWRDSPEGQDWLTRHPTPAWSR